ncbi:MAG TPA: Crp/Fnr family transcriptional regulator [Candidatus Binatia bacterium]|nr:Crp/Fnr family transcriptional regulator [Candidatus Binatia bacterium]
MKRKKKQPFDAKLFLAKVENGRTVTNHPANRTIYAQGDACDFVYFLQTGKAKVTVVSELGKEAVVAMLGKGDFFGEGCLSGHMHHLSTVTTMSDSVIVQIPMAEMKRVIHQEPVFAELFIAHLLARNSRVEADLVDQLFNSSEKRLARLLLMLSNYGKDSKPEPILPKISQETLAEMIGTTRSRVNSFMNKFRKLGFIEYNGEIQVRPSLLNVVLHEKPEISKRNDD